MKRLGAWLDENLFVIPLAGMIIAATWPLVFAAIWGWPDEKPAPHPVSAQTYPQAAAFTSATLFDATPGTFGVYRVTLDNGETLDLPGCEEEDSSNCFWAADERGNGVGHSFADVHAQTLYRVGDEVPS